MNQFLDGLVPLRRGRELVSDFFSTLGSRRETRLTAALGYLIAKAPNSFGPIFLGRQLRIDEVLIEESEKSNRYDLVIKTPKKLVVVEAKTGYAKELAQIKRYIKRLIQHNRKKRVVLYLLDRGSEALQGEMKELEQKEVGGQIVLARV